MKWTVMASVRNPAIHGQKYGDRNSIALIPTRTVHHAKTIRLRPPGEGDPHLALQRASGRLVLVAAS